MATTSIWRVKGWLGKVLIYVENPDKTENPAAFEKQGMDGQEAQGLSDVIEYAAACAQSFCSRKSQPTSRPRSQVYRHLMASPCLTVYRLQP